MSQTLSQLEEVYAKIDEKMKQVIAQLAAKKSQNELRDQEKIILGDKLMVVNKEVASIDKEINNRIKDLVARRKIKQDQANLLREEIQNLEDEELAPSSPPPSKKSKKRKRKQQAQLTAMKKEQGSAAQ